MKVITIGIAMLGAIAVACRSSGADDLSENDEANVAIPGELLSFGGGGLREGNLVVAGMWWPPDAPRPTIGLLDLGDGSTGEAKAIEAPIRSDCPTGLVADTVTSGREESGVWVQFSCFGWEPSEVQVARLDAGGSWTFVPGRFKFPSFSSRSLTTAVVDDREVVVLSTAGGLCVVDPALGESRCAQWSDLGSQCLQLDGRATFALGADGTIQVLRQDADARTTSVEVSLGSDLDVTGCRPGEGIRGQVPAASVGTDGTPLVVRASRGTARLIRGLASSDETSLPASVASAMSVSVAGDAERSIVCWGSKESESVRCQQTSFAR